MTRSRSAILAIALSLGLVLGACGDDASPNNDDAADSGDNGGSAEGAFTINLSADGIELPDTVAGGVVEVTLETDLEEPEVNLTKVPDGTTEQALKEAVASATSGGPIPEIIEATSGITGGTQFVELPPGSYIAWSDSPASAEEGDSEGEEPAEPPAGEEAEGEEGGGEGEDAPDPNAFTTQPFTVEGDGGGEFPDTGSITARDYSFDVKLKAGEDKFLFRNEGPDQFHHAVLMDFGTVAPEDVEENLVKFLESEGEGEPPAAFKDLDPEKIFSVGGSAVFSPGLGGTADAKVESGNTYAVVCFLQDRAGGPPHVFGHGMRSVFKVE